MISMERGGGYGNGLDKVNGIKKIERGVRQVPE